MFDSNLNLPFNNGGSEHAKVVLSKILTESKIDIKTLCSTLTNDDTYFDETYRDDLEAFLSIGGKYTVILNNYIKGVDIDQYILDLKSKYEGQINIYTTNQVITLNVRAIKSDDVLITVGDGQHCRTEFDTKHRKALCVFHDNVSGNDLITLFNTILKPAKEVVI